MKNKKLILVAAALLMLGAISIKPAMAYFTDTHTANGSVLFGKRSITPHEKTEGLTKTITVENTGDYPVYVRVKLFAGDTHGLKFNGDKSPKWSFNGNDEFYYFETPISPKELTGELVVDIDPVDETAGEFNVIVVEEGCPVGEDGQPTWDKKITNTETFNSGETQPEAESTEPSNPEPTESEGGAN